jgi:hypothetical protein
MHEILICHVYSANADNNTIHFINFNALKPNFKSFIIRKSKNVIQFQLMDERHEVYVHKRI